MDIKEIFEFESARDFVADISVVETDVVDNFLGKINDRENSTNDLIAPQKYDGDKTVILVSGGIAVGKSTIVWNLINLFDLAKIPYISANKYYDKYFKGKSTFIKDYNAARELTDKELNTFMTNSTTFIWETVLSKSKKRDFIAQLKSRGYKIISFFVGVDDFNISIDRAKKRERLGYYGVKENFIRDRHFKSLKSLSWLYANSDIFIAIDNSEKPNLVFYSDGHSEFTMNAPPWFSKNLRSN